MGTVLRGGLNDRGAGTQFTAGSVVVWIPPDVHGFRLFLARDFLARDWHRARPASGTGEQSDARTGLLRRTRA
jgi:hypothetical protein